MEEIKHISAVQIREQKDTNSVPFVVLCDDGEMYIAKSIFKPHPPFEDLINEILGVYFLEIMGVSTIKPSLIKIPQGVFETFKLSGEKYDRRYDSFKFDDMLFFGSLYQLTTTEVELYNTILKNKYDYNKYINPLDFIKIGVFDYWFGNMDRRGSNPNILIDETEEGKFVFLPIDHTQAFANQSNYKHLRLALMSSPQPKSILKTPMSKSIIKFADSKIISNLDNVLFESFKEVLNNIDFVFKQVPSSLGLSKKGKEKIKEILSNEERNKRVSKLYFNYI